MILPMKKVTVLVLDSEKEKALYELRKLGLIHMESVQGASEHLSSLKADKALVEQALFTIEDAKDKKAKIVQKEMNKEEAMACAKHIRDLSEEKKDRRGRNTALFNELEQLKRWGEIDLDDLAELAEKGLKLTLCEMSTSEYHELGEDVTTMFVNGDKYNVRFLVIGESESLEHARISMPKKSTAVLQKEMEFCVHRISEIDEEIRACVCYTDGLKQTMEILEKELEMENYICGLDEEIISENPDKPVGLTWLNGYVPAEDASRLAEAAKTHEWGITFDDPTIEDEVPTKLRNNKFVSLIYPLTDFLGTVPGYFEYDISGWFLAFMLIFFGIIFGDGGYGLLITAVGLSMVIKAKAKKQEVAPIFWLITLLGAATIVWGLVTCTWFGIEPELLPSWLTGLSIPVISNVYESRMWYPFWTNGEAGLTTAQNLQIFCFTLALIQLSVAHIMGMIRNKASLKLVGELGSLLQLWGMYYVVLTLVVNGEVFGLGRVIAGIPVGTLAIILVAAGFVMSFIFSSYEGSIKDSIMDSLKNIVSILLGVVNIFSDIVSYIRLWAVGLAGSAISATINEMAGPLFGHLAFLVFAFILLVFGHGLNMILNLLSVIVHGVRLNTLEFSSHLGMSWGGFKYKPFEE